jgi:hypothetical protein
MTAQTVAVSTLHISPPTLQTEYQEDFLELTVPDAWPEGQWGWTPDLSVYLLVLLSIP